MLDTSVFTLLTRLSLPHPPFFPRYFPLPGIMGERLFHVFDRDGSGAIDYQEFLTGMALIYHGTLEEKKKFLFEMYDLDGDGVVTKEELYTMLSHVPAAFKILEASMGEGGGEQSAQQAQPEVNTRVREVVERAFEGKPPDGVLTYEEFQTAVSHNSAITEIINIFYDEGLPETGRSTRESHITSAILPKVCTISIRL